MHSTNNRTDLKDNSVEQEKNSTAQWNKHTNTVDEQKEAKETSPAKRTWVDRALDREEITNEIGGIVQNGTVDFDLKVSDVTEEPVKTVPDVQNRLEKLLQAASTEDETEKYRHIVGRSQPKVGAEVKEELIVVQSSAGLVSKFNKHFFFEIRSIIRSFAPFVSI